MKEVIEIDGGHGEAGGQLLRTAVGLSAVTNKPFRMFNIRKGRCKSGIRPQHLEAIRSVASLCNAKVSGAKIDSMELEFYPEKIKSGKISINIPTAGSVGLVLQGLMIAAAHTDNKIDIEIRGGATNGKWAAPVNYIKYVLLQLLEKIGYKAYIEIKKYGYYPKGGSIVNVAIEPCQLKPIEILEQGKILAVSGISHAASQLKNAKVSERQKERADEILYKKFDIVPKIDVLYNDTICPGSAIDLWMTLENSVLGSEGLGERGKIAEKVGEESADKLIEQYESKAPIDEHACDQLLPYMALATISGNSKIRVARITNHARTNIWVIEKFLPVKFKINEKDRIISCKSV